MKPSRAGGAATHAPPPAAGDSRRAAGASRAVARAHIPMPPRALAWTTLAATAMLVAVLGAQTIVSVDYWWQLQTGADIAHHGIPHIETYSFTQAHQPRYEVRWLYCLGLWAVTQLAGPAGATLVKTLLGVAIFGLGAWIGARRMPSVAAAGVVAIAALASSQRLVVRPEMWSYAFVLVFVAILARLREKPTRWMWALPAVQVVWVNMHGLFLLGPALVGAWAVAEAIGALVHRDAATADRRQRLRTATILLGATVAACFVTPYGPRVVSLALAQFGALRGTAQKTFTLELRSPFAFEQDFTALFYYKILIGVAAVSALLAWRDQSLFWLLVAGSQLWLSASAIRNVPLFCVVAVPFVLRNLRASRLLRRPAAAAGAGFATWIVLLATLGLCLHQLRLLVTDRFYVRQHLVTQFGLGIAPHVFPDRGVDFLASTGVRGPLLTSESTGSYLIARGYPVFLDPRGDVYPDAFLETYRALATEPESDKLRALVQKYDLRAALIDLDVSRLVQHLMREPNWRLVYLDSEAALFLRRDTAPEVPELDLDRAGQAWFDTVRRGLPPPKPYASAGFFGRVATPTPYNRLARTCFERGAFTYSKRLYEDALAAYPAHFEGWMPLGHMAMEERDYARALEFYERALEAQPESAELQARAGLAALQANQMDAAVQHADAAVRLAPEDWKKMALKGTVELKRGQAAVAEQWLSHALEQAPMEASLHRNLAKAHYMQGHMDEAIAAFQRTLLLEPRDAGAARDLARILAARGDRQQAQLWLEKALALVPNDPQALALRDELAVKPQ